jgi:hypothetical protein
LKSTAFGGCTAEHKRHIVRADNSGTALLVFTADRWAWLCFKGARKYERYLLNGTSELIFSARLR